MHATVPNALPHYSSHSTLYLIALISKCLYPNYTYQFHSLFKRNMRQVYGIRGTCVKGMQKDWRAKEIEERNNETETDMGMGKRRLYRKFNGVPSHYASHKPTECLVNSLPELGSNILLSSSHSSTPNNIQNGTNR